MIRIVLQVALQALIYHQEQTRPINKTRGAINLIQRWFKNEEPPFKVKIVDCRDSNMWYAKLVGTEQVVLRVTVDGYWAREPAGYLNIIFFEDAE